MHVTPSRFIAPTFRVAAAVLASLALATAVASAGDLAETVIVDDAPRVRALLVVDPSSSAPDLRAGVLLQMAPGWHVYAEDPGDTGLPTRLEWSAVGATVEKIPWPEPQQFFDAELDITSNGYAGQVLLPVRLRSTGNAITSVQVRGEVLACKESCVPGSFDLDRDLTAPATATDAIAAPLFPKPGASTAFDLAGLGQALLLAVLGGLLLNLMPCVLPVLAIKALALTEGASHRRDAWAHGAAYAGGVLASMAALAGVVLLLRSGGEAVGWGFQFQQPAYVAGLAVVVVLFAANLLGAFEIQTGTGRLAEFGAQAVGPRRSFFDGLLTVALATPCSAPFLGTAAGFAMSAPAPLTLAVFLAIGLGLAAPLSLVAALPGARRWIPKPGAWMNDFRAILGFVLLGTAAWLVWVMSRSAGADAASGLLAGLVAAGAAAWGFGRLQAHGRTPGPIPFVLAAGLGVALTLGWMRSAPSDSLEADAWRPETVARHLAEGRPTFVYFTADWCLTCKVNERLVLADPRVREAFERHAFAVVRGDWTRRDAALGQEIARLGRSGVPLYAVYSPSAPDDPVLLPEVLSVDRVIGVLADAAGDPPVMEVTSFPTAASMQQADARPALGSQP